MSCLGQGVYIGPTCTSVAYNCTMCTRIHGKAEVMIGASSSLPFPFLLCGTVPYGPSQKTDPAGGSQVWEGYNTISAACFCTGFQLFLDHAHLILASPVRRREHAGFPRPYWFFPLPPLLSQPRLGALESLACRHVLLWLLRHVFFQIVAVRSFLPLPGRAFTTVDWTPNDRGCFFEFVATKTRGGIYIWKMAPFVTLSAMG